MKAERTGSLGLSAQTMGGLASPPRTAGCVEGIDARNRMGLMGRGFASSSALSSASRSEFPFSPLTVGSGISFGIAFPWREVDYSGKRQKGGLDIRGGFVLTPYPATTTREVSMLSVEVDRVFKGGDGKAAQKLRSVKAEE